MSLGRGKWVLYFLEWFFEQTERQVEGFFVPLFSQEHQDGGYAVSHVSLVSFFCPVRMIGAPSAPPPGFPH